MPLIETRESTRTVPVTYRCSRCRKNKCEKVRQIVYTVHSETERFQCPSTGRTSSQTRKTWFKDGVDLNVWNGYMPSLTCETCGELMQSEAIRGVYSEAHKCGSRCTNAKGGDCECQCGGANHGKGYR